MLDGHFYKPSSADQQSERYATDAEQSLLAAVLNNSILLDDVDLQENDSSSTHRNIFSAIRQLHNAGKSVDVVTVAEEMGEEHFEYLVDLTQSAVYANVPAYVSIIKHYSTDRALESLGRRIIDTARQKTNAEDKLILINQEIAKLERVADSDAHHVDDVLKGLLDTLDQRMRGLSSPGISLGFDVLTDKTGGGLRPGEYMVLAARPSMGKTALALNVIAHNLINEKNVLFFSVEMSKEAVIERMVGSQAGLELKKIRSGQFDEEDWPKLELGVRQLKGKNLFLSEISSIPIDKAQSIARQFNRKYGLDLIVVDYLQLMRGKGENRNGEIASISEGLKAMAKQCGCPVIALAQLNRGVEQRPDKRPRNSDLRDSGSIEQDADVIAMIYRDEYYHPDTIDKGIAEIIFTKQREGELGTEILKTDFQRGRFLPAPEQYRARCLPPIKSMRSIKAFKNPYAR